MKFERLNFFGKQFALSCLFFLFFLGTSAQTISGPTGVNAGETKRFSFLIDQVNPIVE